MTPMVTLPAPLIAAFTDMVECEDTASGGAGVLTRQGRRGHSVLVTMGVVTILSVTNIQDSSVIVRTEWWRMVRIVDRSWILLCELCCSIHCRISQAGVGIECLRHLGEDHGVFPHYELHVHVKLQLGEDGLVLVGDRGPVLLNDDVGHGAIAREHSPEIIQAEVVSISSHQQFC